MTNMISPAQSGKKSWFSKPEGIFGTIFGIGALGAIGFFVLPILTAIVWNTVNFGIACVAGFVLTYMLSNKKLWMSLGLLYDILMKKMVGFVIELDPFIIAEKYLANMKKQREKLYEKINELGGQEESLNMKLNEKIKERNDTFLKAEQAKVKGMDSQFALAAAQVGRLDDFINQLTPLKDKLTYLKEYLLAIYKNSQFLIEDTENEIKTKKEFHKTVTVGNNALKSAMAIFKGDPDNKLIYDESMELLKDEIGFKLSSMKTAINISADYMNNIDLNNAVHKEKGLKMLEKIKPEIFLKDIEPDSTPTPTSILMSNNPFNSSGKSGQYGNLLD